MIEWTLTIEYSLGDHAVNRAEHDCLWTDGRPLIVLAPQNDHLWHWILMGLLVFPSRSTQDPLRHPYKTLQCLNDTRCINLSAFCRGLITGALEGLYVTQQKTTQQLFHCSLPPFTQHTQHCSKRCRKLTGSFVILRHWCWRVAWWWCRIIARFLKQKER